MPAPIPARSQCFIALNAGACRTSGDARKSHGPIRSCLFSFPLLHALALALSLSFPALPARASAADNPAATNPVARPKVALVLSGGAARGSAHVGVLKVMEENHIPIDLIAGTSMGAIVGGLYAAGLSPQQMDGIL